jgi:hypothetical protein
MENQNQVIEELLDSTKWMKRFDDATIWKLNW